MSLRDHLPRRGHVTLGELERAAEDRFQDAAVLARQGRRMAAMYFLGYVPEIVLKCTFFRLFGYRANERIRLGPRGIDDPRELGRADLRVAEAPEGLHNPVFWARMVVEMRIRTVGSFTSEMTHALVSRAQRIWTNWTVFMRYCRDRSTREDFHDLWRDVAWVRSQYRTFWR